MRLQTLIDHLREHDNKDADVVVRLPYTVEGNFDTRGEHFTIESFGPETHEDAAKFVIVLKSSTPEE